MGTVSSGSKAQGFALGSAPILSAVATIKQIANGKNTSANQESSNKAKGSISASLSIPPSNEDWNIENFIDVNGDGLADKSYQGIRLG